MTTSASPTSPNGQPSTANTAQLDALLTKIDKYPQAQKIRIWIKENSHSLRPWSEFFDKSRFSRPKNYGDAMQRVNHNVLHYKANYAVLGTGILLYTLLTNLWLLFSVLFLVGSFFWISSMPPNSSARIGNYSVTQRQLYGGLMALSLPILWISSAGSTIFWVIGITGVIVVCHAAVLEKSIESEFADA